MFIAKIIDVDIFDCRELYMKLATRIAADVCSCSEASEAGVNLQCLSCRVFFSTRPLIFDTNYRHAISLALGNLSLC